METYHDEKQDDTKPNLITYVDVEPAHEHDANALQPAIDAAQERDCCPEELTCDTLYGGDDNVRWRAGIEGTNSHLKSDVGTERLRVRGMASVRFAVILKALGLNIMRCAGALCAPLCPCFIRIRDTKQAVANRFN